MRAQCTPGQRHPRAWNNVRGSPRVYPLWVFSTAERGFSAQFIDAAPSAWTFDEYPEGAHGTGMFAAVPASVGEVADWIATR